MNKQDRGGCVCSASKEAERVGGGCQQVGEKRVFFYRLKRRRVERLGVWEGGGGADAGGIAR